MEDAKTLLSMNIADYFIAGVVVISILISLLRGFIKESVSLIIWILGFWIAIKFYQDAAIFLDKNKILPIDAKYSLENYNRLTEEKDKSQRELLAKSFKMDLKNRIDVTAKYIRPAENTM